MSQLAFDKLQTEQKTLIEARSMFSGITVAVDDGNKSATMEQALRDDGAAILILPPLAASRADQVPHQLLANLENAVKLMINPHRNPEAGAANLDVLKAIREIVIAVIAYKDLPGGTSWRTGQQSIFEINTYDPGLWIYDIHFVKEFLIANGL